MKKTALPVIALSCLAIACKSPTMQEHAQEPAETESPSAIGAAIERATQYLLAQQADDHLWHSPNYGNLREGAAMTAFVLYALGDQSFADKNQLQEAVHALLPATRDAGFVTNPGGPDYSSYASAHLLLAAKQLQLDLPDDVRDALIAYLTRAQLDTEEGYGRDSPNFGGWDLSGWMEGERPTTGTNISVSSSVLEALSLYPDHPGVSDAMDAARAWVSRVAADDGGFFFHPRRNHDGNKAGWHDDARNSPRSYGSATTDGLRIHTFLDTPSDDPAVQAAIEWLIKHETWPQVPGFEHETEEGTWADGLRYYYYQSLSQSLHLLPEARADEVAGRLRDVLLQEQQADGSWSNANARMREDDPLIATGFALIALQNAQKWLEKQEE